MESLPEQPIDGLSKPQREEAYQKLARLCAARSFGVESEDDLAKRAEFSSAEVMRISLANWGLSNLLPPQEKRKRKLGAGTDNRREQPLASEAIPLFAERLDVLRGDLEQLEHRRDVFQDGRFSTAWAYAGSMGFDRYDPKTGSELYSDEEWRKLCDKHDGDPNEDEILVLNAALIQPRGAGAAPPEPLTTLIGVYALAGGDMKRLVEALYPDAPSADSLVTLRKRVEGKKRQDKVHSLKNRGRTSCEAGMRRANAW